MALHSHLMRTRAGSGNAGTELSAEERMTLRLLKNRLKEDDAGRTQKQLQASLKRKSA